MELGIETIAFAVGDAHNSIAIHDEVVELGTGLHRDVAELLDLVVHRVDVARAGAGLNFIGTRNGVAAFEEHVVGHEFGAAVLDKLDRVVAAVNDLREQFNVVEAETVFQAVSDEEFAAVLDALSLLHGVDRAGNVAAADGGVAADDRHFSSIRTFLPARPALRAQAIPAKPEPMMTTSYSSSYFSTLAAGMPALAAALAIMPAAAAAPALRRLRRQRFISDILIFL